MNAAGCRITNIQLIAGRPDARRHCKQLKKIVPANPGLSVTVICYNNLVNRPVHFQQYTFHGCLAGVFYNMGVARNN